MNATRIRAFAFVVLALCLSVSDARAGFADDVFALLKKVAPEQADSFEFARYYVAQPEHASLIYGRVAAQDYVFIAILGAVKAARDQPLPGGQEFGYQQCRLPMTLFDAVFSQSDEFIAEYGKEEHIKGYLSEKNAEARQEALNQLTQYVPYLGDIESICHFSFHTSFKTEQDIRNAAESNWQLAKGLYEDLGSGNIAGAVAKLIEAGISADAACKFADTIVTGGWISKTPVLGALAMNACSGFAGTVIKGIATAVGDFINAAGEFIGDAACTFGIGSCSGNEPLDGLFNKNFELLVFNYALHPPAEADQWTTNWWNTVMSSSCQNKTGASAAQCQDAFNQTVASAKDVASKVRLEPGPAYASIYKPALDRVARSPVQSLAVVSLDAACVENLLTRYPWPGLQQYGAKEHNEVFRKICGQARSRADIAGGKSFDQQVAERTAFFVKALDSTGCEGNAIKRVCRSYPSQFACSTVFQNFGVPRGSSMGKHCLVDPVAATLNLAKSVTAKAPGCQTLMIPGHLDVFRTNCSTYADHAACVKTVKGTSGAPAGLLLGCNLDDAAARKAAIDAMLAGMGQGKVGTRPAPGACALGGSTFRCGSDSSFNQCKSLLASQGGVPAGAVRCLRILGTPGTTIPAPGGHVLETVPGGTSGGGRPRPMVIPKREVQATSPSDAADVKADLTKRGCTESSARPGVYSCASKPGYDACRAYRAKGQARGCLIVAGQ